MLAKTMLGNEARVGILLVEPADHVLEGVLVLVLEHLARLLVHAFDLHLVVFLEEFLAKVNHRELLEGRRVSAKNRCCMLSSVSIAAAGSLGAFGSAR